MSSMSGIKFWKRPYCHGDRRKPRFSVGWAVLSKKEDLWKDWEKYGLQICLSVLTVTKKCAFSHRLHYCSDGG
ncbi:MAG: hypothetical protein BROFUL_00827 [Candidatus Brocadia fulgida]|uniref:Uncharacterized protein n=1 Tax=Candidatus Brocadia fulgida TaxID=380242 RepID=A0A0M2UX42_9BACT|nr:MAG: hypothetical protein BROFUL_00827 [Candidatus Brocadia fulgida]MBV6517463.1 hypothetical protein [Candidatus Brocadia fulgida]